MAIDADRLSIVKNYMRVDGEDENAVIEGMIAACDSYLTGAGITRDVDTALYDQVVCSMTLTLYDGRYDEKTTAMGAAETATVRMMLTQLKLRSAYDSEEDEGA